MPDSQGSGQPGRSALGRPRSADATEEVRAAALALAYEGGVQSATVVRIAERSGIAKTTIYRRWPNAAAIVMDAFLEEISPLIRYRRKADVRATFVASIKELAQALRGPRGELLRHLLGAAQSDPDLQKAFWSNWISPRRAQAKEVIAEAKALRQLRDDADEEVLIDTLFGAVYYRMMIPYADISGPYVESLVAQVFSGVLPGAARPRSPGGRGLHPRKRAAP